MRASVKYSLGIWALALSVSEFALAQKSAEITMAPNSEQSGYVTIRNNCKASESFSVTAAPLAGWLKLVGTSPDRSPSSFALEGGGFADYSFTLNSSGLQPGTYDSTIKVICTSCAGSEPPCLQTGPKEFPISMIVTAPPKNPGGEGGGAGAGTGGANTGGKPTSTPPSTPPTTPDTSSGSGHGTPTANGPNSAGGSGSKPAGGGSVSTQGANSTPNDAGGRPNSSGGATGAGNSSAGASNTSDAIPTPTQGGNPWGPLLTGGLLIAAGGAGLLYGSGKSKTTERVPGTMTTSRPATPGSWDATLQTPASDTVPQTTPRASDGGIGQTVGRPTTDIPPTVSTVPAKPYAPGGWDASMHTPLQDRAMTAAAGQSAGQPTSSVPPTLSKVVPETKTAGSWDATIHSPGQDSVIAATPGSGQSREKPPSDVPPTQTTTTPPKTNDAGTWDASVKMGTGDATPQDSAHGTGNAATPSAVPPTQEAPRKKQPGNWDASLSLNQPEHQPGDRNEGGGRTFSRGTTHKDLVDANRPPAPEEAAAAKTAGAVTDDYATREKKIRDAMANRRIAEESPGPIVAGGQTQERVPWDGQYNPTGESNWMKGVREDLAAGEARLRTAVKERWGGNQDDLASQVKGAAYDQVYSDPIRHAQDDIMRRVWQIEIYEAAYKKARESGLNNLAAHAYAQAKLDEWREKSLEDFEQAFGTHFAQLGQALSGDPMGALNKAIEEIGQLVDQAATNVERSRQIADNLERQRMAKAAALQAEAERLGTEASEAGKKIAAEADAAANMTRGRAILLGVGDKPGLIAAAKSIPTKPGYFDVVVHGNQSGFGTKVLDANGNTVWKYYNAQELAEAMKGMGYEGGPVRLISCKTGKVDWNTMDLGVAHDLAKELGVEVTAPVKPINAAEASSSATQWRVFRPSDYLPVR